MPATGRPRRPSPGLRVVVALGGVAVALVLFLVVAKVAGPKSTDQAGSALFRVGSAQRWAKAVAEDGPILFPDLLGGSRDIFLQHLGGDDWRAFEAHAPGAPRRCLVEWRPDSRQFVDACDGRAFPADGTGLVSYPASVDSKGQLVVDLRSAVTPSSTGPG